MVDHGARDHATWSASASDRLWGCPGSLELNTTAPADKESHAAAWGTACHQVSDKCLRAFVAGSETDANAIDYLGTVEKTKSHSIEVDEEVCETAQEYIDYVRDAAKGKELLVEQKFSLADLDPPFDAGGTGDAVILSPDEGLIEIVDLKGGRGVVVEVVGNKQLRTYALGALMANPGPWKRVKVTIVQPRAPHRDGRIRSEEFHVADLIDWTQDLMAAMERAAQGVEWRGTPDIEHALMGAGLLTAGSHCTFCRSAPICPAIEKRALEVAQTHFTPQNTLAKPPAPEALSMEQIVRVLNNADMIQGWLNAVRAYAQDQAESGFEIKHGDSEYVLTEKRGRRAWVEGDEAELVKALFKATGELDTSVFYNEPKLMSPAQVEKVLGAKRKGEIADLWDNKSSGYNLVRADKTSRAAAVAPAKKFFEPTQEN